MASWRRVLAWLSGVVQPERHTASERVMSRERTVSPERIVSPGRGSGRYQPLYRYLRDRYADRVVLRFTEIEDVLGFSLPPAARIAQEWWSGGEVAAEASMLGDRSVTVNLATQVVVYERTPVPRA
jgi:hypothetical protein